MHDVAKLLMTLGGIVFVVGFLLYFIGKLPGDILIRKGNTTFYFPIVTCIVLSVVLSLVMYIINRFR